MRNISCFLYPALELRGAHLSAKFVFLGLNFLRLLLSFCQADTGSRWGLLQRKMEPELSLKNALDPCCQ